MAWHLCGDIIYPKLCTSRLISIIMLGRFELFEICTYSTYNFKKKYFSRLYLVNIWNQYDLEKNVNHLLQLTVSRYKVPKWILLFSRISWKLQRMLVPLYTSRYTTPRAFLFRHSGCAWLRSASFTIPEKIKWMERAQAFVSLAIFPHLYDPIEAFVCGSG